MEEAVRTGDLRLVQRLIRSESDVHHDHRTVDVCKDDPLIVAIKEGHKDITLALLEARASVHAKDKGGWTALHWACYRGVEEVVQALIDRGSRVDHRDNFGNTPLRLAWGNTATSKPLLLAGASCKGFSDIEMITAFRCACHEGDVSVVLALLKNGCSVSILSREVQEKLLFCACCVGDVVVVEALITDGCNVNCVYADGHTPLMDAARKGHEEVVKKLILADANPGIQDELGNTALHIATSYNNIQCGILLAEGGASVRTKNKFSKTPFDLAQAGFKKAIKQALSFATRKTLCIIGNAQSGRSTLIAALQAESNSVFGKIMSRFKRVSDLRKRTAGIEIVSHCSRKYGEVLFFDFAGQDDYHGPHQMFLESLLSKPGVSLIILLVVKATEDEEAILNQIHRWLSPVALMSTPASPPQVIVIGSFLDKVRSRQDATTKLARCIEAARKDLEGERSLQFVGSCLLNCRQPLSEGIDQLCCFLQEMPIPEFRATHTQYSLAWVLSQIRLSFAAQAAVQLLEFSAWIKNNRDNLLRRMPPPEEVCQDLSAAGHALYLQNRKDLTKSWLVLDLPSILHDVYGTLFSNPNRIVNEFGLLHCSHLARCFPGLDLEMVQQLLISLEFCIPVDPIVLKVEVAKLTQSDETSGWLFFPALISAKPPKLTLELLPQQSAHNLCWQLRTVRQHTFSARVLQTVLLRLAAHFVVKQNDKDGIQQHCCNIWWNGIAWQSTVGVGATVHIINNRVIQVVGASMTSADKSCQYLIDVISDIISTVHRLSPKLAAGMYIVHPPKITNVSEDITATPTKELFPVEGIRNSIRDHKEFALSLKDCESQWNMMSVSDLFGGHTPTLEEIERINWTLPESSLAELHIEGNNSPVIPSSAQLLQDPSATPDMRDVDEMVVTAVAANWQRVALKLGVEGCISEVVFKNHPNDCEGACRDMLDRWLRGERHTGEEERTWSTLLSALIRAGFVELESSLRKVHFH